MADLYYDFVFGALTASVQVGDTVVTVDDVSSFPSNSVLAKGDFWVTFDSNLTHPNTFEVVKVTAVNATSNTLTISPAATQTHAIGASVKGCITAEMLKGLRAGLTGSTVPSGTDPDLYNIGDRFYEQSTGLTYIYGASGFTLSPDATAMHDRGNWSASTSYAVNDVVTYNNRRYICTSAITASAPSIIGSTVAHTLATGNASSLTVPLPAGSQTGDLAVVAVGSQSPTTPSGPSGSTLATGGTDQALNFYAKALTATDIGNGSLTVPPQNGNNGTLASITAIRNADTLGSEYTSTASGTSFTMASGAVTLPSLPGVFLAAAMDTTSGTYYPSTTSIPQTLHDTTNSGGSVTNALGLAVEILTTGPSPQVVWSDAGSTFHRTMGGVLAYNGGAFPTASFREIGVIHDSNGRLQAADPAAASDVSTRNYVDSKSYAGLDTAAMHYQGDFSTSTDYAVNDVVRYNGKLYRANTKVISGGTKVVAHGTYSQTTNSGSIPIPAGAMAGDLLLLLSAEYGSSSVTWTNQTHYPTTVRTFHNASGANTYGVYTLALTADDITSGTIAFTGGGSRGGWITYVIRNADAIDANSVYPTSYGDTFAAWTPADTDGALLFRFLEEGINGGSSTSSNITLPSGLSDVTEIYPSTTGYDATGAAGWVDVPAGTTVPAGTATVLHSYGQDFAIQVGVGKIASGFNSAKFDELATDNPVIANTDTVTASGAAQTVPDVLTATMHKITLTAACTLTFPAAAAGKRFRLALTQNATGGWMVTWPGTVKWPGGTAPTLTATANATDLFEFECYDGTNWLGRPLAQNY